MNASDPRARRSRKAMYTSLIMLALQKGYGKFTIRDLTRHANVGYATFFRHCKSLDEMLTHIFLCAYQDLANRIAEQENLFDQAVELYSFVSEHSDLYRVYFQLSPNHPVRAYFTGESKKLILQFWDTDIHSHVPLPLSLDYLLQCSDLLMGWYLKRLDEYTPEEIATMHFDLIIKGPRHVPLAASS